MKRWLYGITATLALSIGFPIVASTMDQTPSILLEAVHCLDSEAPGWPLQQIRKGSPLRLGYFLDKESYPGDEVLYLVDYQGSGRSKGLLYMIVLTEKDGHRSFDIQNNTRFLQSSKEIDFLNPPLGGIWTQQHIQSAIKRIGLRSTFLISTQDRAAAYPGTACRAYWDKQ
jgi:hypothetical protein